MHPKIVNNTFCHHKCEYLLPYGKEEDLTAKCAITGKNLMWYDFWIATECSFILFLEDEEEIRSVENVEVKMFMK